MWRLHMCLDVVAPQARAAKAGDTGVITRHSSRACDVASAHAYCPTFLGEASRHMILPSLRPQLQRVARGSDAYLQRGAASYPANPVLNLRGLVVVCKPQFVREEATAQCQFLRTCMLGFIRSATGDLSQLQPALSTVGAQAGPILQQR